VVLDSVLCNALEIPKSLLESASTAHIGRRMSLRQWAHYDMQTDLGESNEDA
jgi:hypothetical protein